MGHYRVTEYQPYVERKTCDCRGRKRWGAYTIRRHRSTERWNSSHVSNREVMDESCLQLLWYDGDDKKLRNPNRGMTCRLGFNLMSFQFNSNRDMKKVLKNMTSSQEVFESCPESRSTIVGQPFWKSSCLDRTVNTLRRINCVVCIKLPII